MHVVEGLSSLFSLTVPLWFALLAIAAALSIQIAISAMLSRKPPGARTLRIMSFPPQASGMKRRKLPGRGPFHRSDNKVEALPDADAPARPTLMNKR